MNKWRVSVNKCSIALKPSRNPKWQYCPVPISLILRCTGVCSNVRPSRGRSGCNILRSCKILVSVVKFMLSSMTIFLRLSQSICSSSSSESLDEYVLLEHKLLTTSESDEMSASIFIWTLEEDTTSQVNALTKTGSANCCAYIEI